MNIHRIPLSLLILLGLVACQTSAPFTPVATIISQEFSLAPGQSTAVAGTDLTLTLQGVIGDERCPRNVACVESGPVTVSLSVRQGNGNPSDFTLQTFTDENGRSPNVQFEGVTNRTEVGGYLIRIGSVTPYPADPSATTEPSAYRVVLIVSNR